MKQKSKLPLILIIVVVAAAVGFGIWMGLRNSARAAASANQNTDAASAQSLDADKTNDADQTSAANTDANADAAAGNSAGLRSEDELNKTIYYNGKTYNLRSDLTTVLFMGVDDTEDTEHTELMTNGGRSDTIILFVLNDTDKTAEMIDISRDTITEVDVYDDNGEFKYSGDMQITLQYSFGDSPKRSCWLTKRTVSELLYGTQIDAYLSLTMDGIARIIDLMGGLSVTMPADYTYINEAYTEGAQVTLDGAAAEKFVRYRDIEEFGSNNERMMRQSWFMREVFAKLKKAPDMGSLLDRLLDQADKYVETDMSGEQIKALGSYTLADQAITLPGKDKEGMHDEFYVDDAALQDLLVEIFYEEDTGN